MNPQGGHKRIESGPIKHDQEKLDALRAMLVRPVIQLRPTEKICVKSEGDPELLQFFPGGTVVLADDGLQPMGSTTQISAVSTVMSDNPARLKTPTLLTGKMSKPKASNFSCKAPTKTPTKTKNENTLAFVLAHSPSPEYVLKSQISIKTSEKTPPTNVREGPSISAEKLVKNDHTANSMLQFVHLNANRGSYEALNPKKRTPSLGMTTPHKRSSSTPRTNRGSNTKTPSCSPKRSASNTKRSASKVKFKANTKGKRKSSRRVNH